jgi:hypothetical protein
MKTSITVLGILFFAISALLALQPNENVQMLTAQSQGNEGEAAAGNSAHFDLQIGSFKDGKIAFAANPATIKTNWTKVINDNAKLNITITDIKIIQNDDGFFLVGRDTEKQASSIIRLILDGETLYEHKNLVEGDPELASGISVTCKGPETTGNEIDGECEPQIEQGVGWYCTDCSVGDCVKTTVTTIGGGVAG